MGAEVLGAMGVFLGAGLVGWGLRRLNSRTPRCSEERRGEIGLYGGCLLALGILQWSNPRPWLPYLMGGILLLAGISFILSLYVADCA